jgi:hypothetical protein
VVRNGGGEGRGGGAPVPQAPGRGVQGGVHSLM